MIQWYTFPGEWIARFEAFHCKVIRLDCDYFEVSIGRIIPRSERRVEIKNTRFDTEIAAKAYFEGFVFGLVTKDT